MKKLMLQAFAETTAPTGETAAAAGQPDGTGAAPDPQTGNEPSADKSDLFEELIRGEYHDEFAKRVKNIIDRRFAREKRAEQPLPKQPTADEPMRTEAQNQAYVQLLREVDDAKQIYPNLDLAAEAKNPAFVQLLRAGMPVRDAFEASHHDEMLRDAMRQTAAAVARQVSEGIRSAAERPPENGAAGTAAQSRYNVMGMDKTQRRALIARARAGEKIVL